jgi:hypothetical protein
MDSKLRRARRVLTVALALLLTFSVDALATAPGSNGKIAFNRGGEIWTMAPDGTNQSSLVPGGDPAWTSNGAKLAYVCGPSHASPICTANADGTSAQVVSGEESLNFGPTWSPDGRYIV